MRYVDPTKTPASYVTVLADLASGKAITGETCICLPAPLTPTGPVLVADADDEYPIAATWEVVTDLARMLAAKTDDRPEYWNEVVGRLNIAFANGEPIIDNPRLKCELWELGAAADLAAKLNLVPRPKPEA